MTAPASLADSAVAHPRNRRFRSSWHRLALRVFATVPDFVELRIAVDGCPPLVWGTAGDVSQVRRGGDMSVWGPVVYTDTRPVTIVDEGPPSVLAGMWRLGGGAS